MLSKVDRYQPKIHLVASGISRVVDSQRRVEYTFKFKWHTYTKWEVENHRIKATH